MPDRPFLYQVVNPHPFAKTDVVWLPTDFWEDWRFAHGYCVEDETGARYPAQRLATVRGAMIACLVQLQAGERRQLRVVFTDQTPAQPERPTGPVTSDRVFENEAYRLGYGPAGITSLVCLTTQEELLCRDAPMLGAPVYQLFPGANRWEAAGFGYRACQKPAQEVHQARLLGLEVVEDGEVLTHLKASFAIEGAVEAYTHYYLYRGLPRLSIAGQLTKTLVRDAEGMYLSLPFTAEGGSWYLDKPGAFFTPDKEFPGGCVDYYTVDRGLALCGERTSVVVNTLDTPLVMIGGLKMWEFGTRADTSGPVYSWLCNNKWETNFRTQCAGYLESRYSVALAPAATPQDLPQVLEADDQPLLVTRA